MKGWQDRAPSQALESSPALSHPGFWGWWQSLASWARRPVIPPLALSSHGHLPVCIHVHVAFCKVTSRWVSIPSQSSMIWINWLRLQRPHFQRRSHSKIPGEHKFWGGTYSIQYILTGKKGGRKKERRKEGTKQGSKEGREAGIKVDKHTSLITSILLCNVCYTLIAKLTFIRFTASALL